MDIKPMLPEMNENQRKWLKRTLLDIVAKAREQALPLAYIEKELNKLFKEV